MIQVAKGWVVRRLVRDVATGPGRLVFADRLELGVTLAIVGERRLREQRHECPSLVSEAKLYPSCKLLQCPP